MKVNRKVGALVSTLVLAAGATGLTLSSAPASAQQYIPWSMPVKGNSGPIKDCENNYLCLYSGPYLTDPIIGYNGSIMHDLRYNNFLFAFSAQSVANATLGKICTYNCNHQLTNIIAPRSAFNLAANKPGQVCYVKYPC